VGIAFRASETSSGVGREWTAFAFVSYAILVFLFAKVDWAKGIEDAGTVIILILYPVAIFVIGSGDAGILIRTKRRAGGFVGGDAAEVQGIVGFNLLFYCR